MIKCYGIDFTALPPGEFDAPLGLASGAGDIFGITGGVMEATLRAASELVTGKPADRLDFTEVRAVEGAPRNLRGHRRPQHPRRRGQRSDQRQNPAGQGEGRRGAFHVIEVMACPGGCCGGGGQPYPPEGVKVLDPDWLFRRGPAPCTRSTAARSSASRTRTRPSKKSTSSFLGGPGTGEGPRTAAHPLPRPKLPRGDPMSTLHRQLGTSGGGRPGWSWASRSWRFIEKCRGEPHPESQLIAVLHKVQSQFGYLADAAPRRRGPTDAGAGGQGGGRGQLLPLLPPASRAAGSSSTSASARPAT